MPDVIHVLLLLETDGFATRYTSLTVNWCSSSAVVIILVWSQVLIFA